MPVLAEADFCSHGFTFAQLMFDNGTPIKFFNPKALWIGRCTNKTGTHTHTCEKLFHNQTFCMPASVSLSVLERAKNYEAQRSYAGVVASAGHLAEMCERLPATAPLARQRMMELEIESLTARHLRILLRHSGINKAMLHNLPVQSNAAEDTYAVSLYRGWFLHRDKLPCDFDRRIYAHACKAIERLPLELRIKILAKAFSGPTGFIA